MPASGRDASPETAVSTQVKTEHLTVTLELPPLIRGQQAVLVATVRDNESGQPVRGADVLFHLERSGRSPETAGAQPRLNLQAEEVPQAGLYRASHTFDQSGAYDIMATVRPGTEDHAPVTISASQEVREQGESNKWLPAVGLGALAAGIGVALVGLSALGMVIAMGVMM